jgi:diphthamide biosynthesis protein 2
MLSEKHLALIKTLAINSITLQFSDELLGRAADVAHSLVAYGKAHILADTTFGSCCIDSVAAEHVLSDLLIHFGHACLSPPVCTYPVIYVFEEKPAELAKLISAFLSLPAGEYVVVYYDVAYHHTIPALMASLEGNDILPFIVWTDIDTVVNYEPIDRTGCTHFHGRYYTPPPQEFSVLYIGGESMLLTHLTMSSKCNQVH